ncbi:Predicted nucleotide-binding protein containing TIR-like domain [Halpernia humi]|uniref:Predicted nucleotide-binding protein containing TIR-like domain n=1 Tax=Halpernia humi TaxID=493375 RepID=A0A1H5Z8E9_9FLAO|nr:nucleotide-binding protein [Halpernia humi]SEG31897.1 Predicted nucleotide-binding protein containing TIR-like domain [Halpernia humi]
MKEKIKQLIDESKSHTFENNRYYANGLGYFSRPNPEFQAWIAECEDFILSNYGHESAPWRIFERFERNNLDGNYTEEVEKQKDIIISSLTACLRILPKTGELKKQIVTPDLDLSKVFIVHGHDALLKTEVARFIEKLNLTPIILHEQASSGKTIIEKIEDNSNVGFGVVLYTPCDVGAIKGEPKKLNPRARQNVIFEHGFLIGKIGRKNVCALVKGNVEKPNDISGVVYISTDDDWKLILSKELRNSGYSIDMNLVI